MIVIVPKYSDLQKVHIQVGGVLQGYEYIVHVDAVLEELYTQLLQTSHLKLVRLQVDLHHHQNSVRLVGVTLCAELQHELERQ